MTHDRKVTLIVGAGATFADTEGLSERSPLDGGFFSDSNKTNRKSVNIINKYMQDNYSINILYQEGNFLEKVMVCIYTDIFNKDLAPQAIVAFQELISLYTKRIAKTTNNVPITENLLMYRIIDRYLTLGFKPENISIITFNHDLHIEKILYHLTRSEKWRNSGVIYRFPSMYMAGFTRNDLTSPTNSGDDDLFDVHHEETGGIHVLKLHGSLNWYSVHNTERLSPHAMFNPERKIRITRRQKVETSMRLKRKHGRKHTFPIIVPPVIHKSSILHNNLKIIWRHAEEILRNSTELTIFGYSCPGMDYESSNLLIRSLRNRENLQKISVINPNSQIVKHYIDMLHLKKACFYSSAQEFLDSDTHM